MPPFDAFLGGTHEAQAVIADQQDTINLYFEPPEVPGDRPKLLPTPGVELLDSGSGGSGRAHYFVNGREFLVIGTTFYEADSGGALTSRGTVALGENPATISSNGDIGGQLFITSGDNGYIFTLATNTLAQITELDGKAMFGAHLDGYFVALDTGASKFYFSNLAPDGNVWDTGEDFAIRTLAPDRWIAMAVLGRLIWLFGEHTTETWYDTGKEFPFAPTPNGLFPYGIVAPFSIAILGEYLCWLGTTSSGRIAVLRAQGGQPEVISTKALEAQIEDYTSIATAVADSYSERGHTFYLLNFDPDNVTHAYDAETKQWAKRGTWVFGENRYVSWRPRFYAFAHNEHRILDAFGGSLYRMSTELSTDVDELPIKRARRAPAINEQGRRIPYHSFALDVESEGVIYESTLYPSITWHEDEADTHFTYDASTSTGDIASYSWSDNHGNSDTGVSVTFNYSIPADISVTITLVLTGTDGSTSTLEATFNTTYAAGQDGSAAGAIDSTTGVGRAPLLMLRLSNDGGKTFPWEQWREVQKDGEWLKRVRWNRLGSARRRVFEVSWTDPGIKAITGCYLNDLVANG